MPLPRCSPVTSGVPSSSEAQLFVASTASGSASTCRLTVMSFGTARPANGPSAANDGEVLRLFPGETAAEAAAAAAQLHRHQIVIGLRQARAGKAHQHAALLDPCADAFANFRRQRADIGQHDHRQLLVEKLRDRLLRRAAIAEPHIGERRQRAGEIERRCQQRLRGIVGRSADDADGAPAPALVEQLHRAGRSFAGDFKPRDVVAQFDRKIERGFGLAGLRRKGIAGLADRRALVRRARAPRPRQRRHPARSTFTVIFAAAFSAATRASGGGRAAFENRQRPIADGLAQGLREIPARARYRRHPTARRSRSRRSP